MPLLLTRVGEDIRGKIDHAITSITLAANYLLEVEIKVVKEPDARKSLFV